MGILIGIIILVIAIYNLFVCKKMDYLSIYTLIWSNAIILASLKLFGMNDYSEKVFLIIFLGLISFIIFFLIGRYMVRKKILFKYDENVKSYYKLNDKVIYILIFIVTIFVIFTGYRTITLLRSGLPMGTIHAMYLNRGNELFYQTSLLRELHSKIIVPSLYAFIPLSVYLIFFEKKKYKNIIIIIILDVILWTLATGGRIILIYFIVDVLLALPLSSMHISKQQFKKLKKTVFKAVILISVIVICYTLFRKEFGKENVFLKLIEEFYSYISLCIPLSAHWFEYLDSNNIVTNGVMFLNGILSNINWMFVKFLGLNSFHILEIPNYLAQQIEIMVPIFQNASCNAFVTYLFYFYADFRYLGVFLGSGVYGLLSGKINKNVYSNKNVFSILIYLLFAQSILKVFIRWEFFNSAYIISFIILRFMVKKIKLSN